jgi:hypothetical protein
MQPRRSARAISPRRARWQPARRGHLDHGFPTSDYNGGAWIDDAGGVGEWQV